MGGEDGSVSYFPFLPLVLRVLRRGATDGTAAAFAFFFAGAAFCFAGAASYLIVF